MPDEKELQQVILELGTVLMAQEAMLKGLIKCASPDQLAAIQQGFDDLLENPALTDFQKEKLELMRP